MKRLFSNLKAIVAVVAMTTMMGAAVSCSSEYDDTNITNRLDIIEKDLAALKERVAALEESLNAQVKALADLKAENAFVTDVTVKDGNTVVTLSDGTSFTVYAECTDEFVDTDKYLSVKEDNGVYYWAFFTADGFVAYLEVNGEKVPVYQESEDCACSLVFQVDETTGNLLVSIDGGATFVDSGICMNEEEDGETNVGACIFTGVAVDEENGTVTFTTPDGEFTVALAEVIEFNVKDTLYVAAGKSKSVTFEAGEAVSDVYVMNQPLGWSAYVEGNTLTVNAPKKEIYNMGGAEKAGVIALHLNTASGACKVAKLNVSYAELSLNIDKQGNIVIKNTLVETFMTTNEFWQEVEVTDFVSWHLVVLPIDEYNGNLEESMMNSYYYADVTDNSISYYGMNYERLPYEEGVVEELICTGTLEDFLYASTYGYLPYEGESFVVAVVPDDMKTFNYNFNDAVIVEFKQPKIAVSVAEATWQTVYLDVTLRGCQTYFVDFASKEEIAQYTDPAEFYAEKLWMYDTYSQYGVLKLEEDYANSYIEFNEFMNYGASYFTDFGLAPGAEYELSILAIQEGKEEYTYEDLVIIPFALNDIVAAETPAEITMEAVVDYTSIKPTVTVPETTVVMYYTWLDEVVEDEAAQAELITTLVNGYYKVNDFEENGYVIAHSNDRYLSNWDVTYNLTPGQTKVMAVLAIDNDGNYTLKQQAFTTKQVAVNETYTLGVGELSIEGGKLNVPVTGLDGAAISKYRYYLVDTSYYSLKNNETISAEMAISTHSHYKDITGDDITNPLVISQGLSGYSYKALVAGTTYKFALVALFADDTVSNVVIVDEVTYDMEFVKATDPAWEASKPTFTITSCEYDAEMDMYDVYYKFELPEGVGVYPSIMDPEYLQNQVGKSAKIRYMLDNCTTDWDEDGLLNNYVRDTYKLYFPWEDAEGKLYEVAEVDLTEYYDAAKNPAGGEELQPDLNTYGFTAVRANIMSGYAQIAFDGGALQDFQIELNNAGYNPETFALVPGTYTLGDGYDDFVISKGSSATFVEGAEPTAMTLTIVDAGDGKYQFGFTATVFGQNIEDRFTLPISAWS